VSISPIGSVTTPPPAIEALDPIDPFLEAVTSAQPAFGPVTPPTEEVPPTGAAAATLSAINAQLNNTDTTSGLLAQSYAGVALLSSAATLQTVYATSVKPAIAPIEPLNGMPAYEEIETSG
jgi:hypothetical protein